IRAVANASVTTHSSWPVIPFRGIETVLSPLSETLDLLAQLQRVTRPPGNRDQGQISGEITKPSRPAGDRRPPSPHKNAHSSARFAAQATSSASDSVV